MEVYSPLMGCPHSVKYTTFGLKNGRMVVVASKACAPKMTGIKLGMPTSRLMLHTNLAVELALGMCRNSSRSKA